MRGEATPLFSPHLYLTFGLPLCTVMAMTEVHFFPVPGAAHKGEIKSKNGTAETKKRLLRFLKADEADLTYSPCGKGFIYFSRSAQLRSLDSEFNQGIAVLMAKVTGVPNVGYWGSAVVSPENLLEKSKRRTKSADSPIAAKAPPTWRMGRLHLRDRVSE